MAPSIGSPCACTRSTNPNGPHQRTHARIGKGLSAHMQTLHPKCLFLTRRLARTGGGLALEPLVLHHQPVVLDRLRCGSWVGWLGGWVVDAELVGAMDTTGWGQSHPQPSHPTTRPNHPNPSTPTYLRLLRLAQPGGPQAAAPPGPLLLLGPTRTPTPIQAAAAAAAATTAEREDAHVQLLGLRSPNGRVAVRGGVPGRARGAGWGGGGGGHGGRDGVGSVGEA